MSHYHPAAEQSPEALNWNDRIRRVGTRTTLRTVERSTPEPRIVDWDHVDDPSNIVLSAKGRSEARKDQG